MNIETLLDPAVLMPTILLVPLVAAIISAFFLRRSKHGAAVVSVTACGVVCWRRLLCFFN